MQPEDGFFQLKFQLVCQPAPLFAGKKGIDNGNVGHEGKTQLSGENIRVFHGDFMGEGDTLQHGEDGLRFQGVGELVNILIVGVKGRLVDAGQGTELPNGNLFQGLFRA